jgi:hypothetical protein
MGSAAKGAAISINLGVQDVLKTESHIPSLGNIACQGSSGGALLRHSRAVSCKLDAF